MTSTLSVVAPLRAAACQTWRIYNGRSGGIRVFQAYPCNVHTRELQVAAMATDVEGGVVDSVRADVDITRKNFKDVLPLVERALAECTFFSFDCEMTGLFLMDKQDDYLDDPQERYEKMAECAKAFIINQFGLSTFRYEKGGYTASTFNFYVFPEPYDQFNRRFMCEPSALSFLASQGFDFNKVVYEGVPFMSVRTRDWILSRIDRPNESRSVEVTKPEDVTFLAELKDKVLEWMSDPERPVTLDLPAVNSYQRLLSYQALAENDFGVEDHPGFFVKRVSNGTSWPSLRLIRVPDMATATRLQQEDKEERIRAVHDAAGFARVFELMRESKKPGVGHNAMFDINYSVQQFVNPELPSSWSDYKKMVQQWFPGGLYDTKYLARQLPEVFQDQTSLGDVYKTLTQEEGRDKVKAFLEAHHANPSELLEIRHAPGFEKYWTVEAGGLAHEAGYDAFMTGCAFAHLVKLLEIQSRAKAGHEGEALEASPGIQQEGESLAHLEGMAAAVGDIPLSGQSDHDVHLSPPSDMAVDGPQDVALTGLAQNDLDVLAAVKQYKGRINVGRSDMPYAALWGPDPVLERPHVFHMRCRADKPMRAMEIQKIFREAELGRVRVKLLDRTSALVETDPSFCHLVMQKLSRSEQYVVETYITFCARKRGELLDDDQDEALPSGLEEPMLEEGEGDKEEEVVRKRQKVGCEIM